MDIYGKALQYPIISIPLNVAYPDGHLRQGNKSNLRSQIIADSPLSLSELAPTDAPWNVTLQEIEIRKFF